MAAAFDAYDVNAGRIAVHSITPLLSVAEVITQDAVTIVAI